MALFILCYVSIWHVEYLASHVIRPLWIDKIFNIIEYMQSMSTYVCQSILMSACLSVNFKVISVILKSKIL